MKGMKLDVWGLLMVVAVFCLAVGLGGMFAAAAAVWPFVGVVCDGVFLLLVAGALWLVAWESGRRFERQFGCRCSGAGCGGEEGNHEGMKDMKEMGRG